MKRIIATVLLCLLLCGCASEPETKTVWLMTSVESYTDPTVVTKTEYIYDAEGYLRRQVSSYAGHIQQELIATQWDGWGNATMLVKVGHLPDISDFLSATGITKDLMASVYPDYPFVSYPVVTAASCERRKYDERGNLMYTATASPGTLLEDGSYAYDSLRYTAVYTYDEEGNLISLYQPKLSSSYDIFYRYTYENGQKVKSQTYRLSSSLNLEPTRLEENALSRFLVSTTVHSYDQKGRLLRDTTTSSSGSKSETTYEYYTDPDTGHTNCIQYRENGMTTVTVTDAHGNIIRQEADVGSDVMVTTYTYTPIQIPVGSPRQG